MEFFTRMTRKNISTKTKNGEEKLEVNKFEVKQQTYAHNKSKLRFVIIQEGGAKMDPHFAATWQEMGDKVKIPHGKEEAVERVNVRLECHNMALNGPACNDKSS